MENEWVCDCGNETFLVSRFIFRNRSPHKINGKVYLSRYKCNKNIGMCNGNKCFGVQLTSFDFVSNYYFHSVDDDIENVVELFNEQIKNQIDAKYDVGGEKFMESQREIEKLIQAQ